MPSWAFLNNAYVHSLWTNVLKDELADNKLKKYFYKYKIIDY